MSDLLGVPVEGATSRVGVPQIPGSSPELWPGGEWINFFSEYGAIMRIVGLFRELSSGRNQSLESIHVAAGKLPYKYVNAVEAYLTSGIPLFDVPETTVDPLDNSKRVPGGPSLLGDGEWVWRHDLAYFVKTYAVGLPDEFLIRALDIRHVSIEPVVLQEKWREAVEAYERAEGVLL